MPPLDTRPPSLPAGVAPNPRETAQAVVRAYQRSLRNLEHEHGYVPLAVEGDLPADLHGTLRYSGPGLFSLYGRPYRHWFDGDGAMTALRFDGGRAEGAVRVVMSRELREERAAGRALYSTGATPAPQWWRRLGLHFKNVANTKPMVWNERLFALYEAGLPTELDAATLLTRGETDLDGALHGYLCAHFHDVPARQAMYNFSIERGRRNTLNVYEFPHGGRAVRKLASIVLPFGSGTMLHDFIATERHLVFFIPPVRLRIAPVLLGLKAPLEVLQWRPALGTTVLVVPLDEPQRFRRFEVDAFFQYHFLNAYERGDEIVVDFVLVEDFEYAFNKHRADRRVDGHPTQGRLHRAVVNVARERVDLQRLWEQPCEFPQVAPDRQGCTHRYGFLLASRDGEPQTMVAKLDLQGQGSQTIEVGPMQFPSEAVFVPREGAHDEDDGYLLTLVYDAQADRSGAFVYDARDLARGALAKAWFGHMIPRPLHGTWTGER